MAEQLEAAGIHSPEEFYVRMRQAGFGKSAAAEAQGEAPQPDAGQGVTYLTCGHCGKETMYDAREVMEITRKSLMETGAHPSQDARESEADEEIAKLLNIITQLQEDLMRARSTPSLPSKVERELQVAHNILRQFGRYCKLPDGKCDTCLKVEAEMLQPSTPSLPVQDAPLEHVRKELEGARLCLAIREKEAAQFIADAAKDESEIQFLRGQLHRLSEDFQSWLKKYESGELASGSTPSPDPPPPVQREEWDETVEEWMNHALKEMCLVARSGCKHTEYMTHTDGLRQPLILAMGRCLGYGLAESERLREALRETVRFHDEKYGRWTGDVMESPCKCDECKPARAALAPSLLTKGES